MNWKKLSVTFLRVTIGWHFLYEGVSKLFIENWSAAGYLINSTGPFSAFYRWLGSSETLISIVDPLNIIVLIIIGLGLFIGLACRISAAAGVVLLMLYYFAYPPFGAVLPGQSAGNLFIVNRNLIDAFALLTSADIRFN